MNCLPTVHLLYSETCQGESRTHIVAQLKPRVPVANQLSSNPYDTIPSTIHGTGEGSGIFRLNQEQLHASSPFERKSRII